MPVPWNSSTSFPPRAFDYDAAPEARDRAVVGAGVCLEDTGNLGVVAV